MTNTNFLKAPEVAKMLRTSVQHVYNLSKQGIMPCIKLGKQYRFDEQVVLDWVTSGGSKPFAKESTPNNELEEDSSEDSSSEVPF
jgi:excisionase family DNA binding protein